MAAALCGFAGATGCSLECLVVQMELVTPQELQRTQLELWIEQKLLAQEFVQLAPLKVQELLTCIRSVLLLKWVFYLDGGTDQFGFCGG